MILEKGFEEHDADMLYTKLNALADNGELSKLSPTKLFDAINKGI